MQLSGTGTSRNDKEIHDRRDAGEVEHDGVFTAKLFAQLGNIAGVLKAALQSCFGGVGGDSGGNGKAPEFNSKIANALPAGNTVSDKV